ncbi:MFS transporter [Novosphingobium aquimarinum]|uniref:MFS transporter n=1 Tax=Novosphingobium aquimarinum TaxID=2682494 RepID=UPI0012EC42EB|nr:MFS transporter [Novosphingobium aquimarinum]
MVRAEDERITRGHVQLIALLTIVVMFEGFDVSVTSVVLPYISKDFGATSSALGDALALIAIGSILAFATVRLADRFGRRPVLLVSATAFSLGSLGTVFVDSLAAYTAVQLITRIFLVTQIATAYVIVSEVLPARARGRANGLLGAFGSFGAALPYLLLSPAVTSPLGWRLLFVVGAAPLLTLPFLYRWLPETPVWQAARNPGERRFSALQELRALLAPALRKRTVAMTLVWLIINFASSVSTLFFTLYVVQERQWNPGDLALIAPFGLVGAFTGYLGAGFLMDRIGRRWTLSLLLGALGTLTLVCYLSHDWWAVALGFVGIQTSIGVWVVAYTLNSELFPTELRAAANGWCHNLVARWGVVLAPWALGALSARLGAIAPAAATLGLLTFLAIPLVWILLPETRGQRLEDSAA